MEEDAQIAAQRKKEDKARQAERIARQQTLTFPGPTFIASSANGSQLANLARSKISSFYLNTNCKSLSKLKESQSPPQVQFKKRPASSLDSDEVIAGTPQKRVCLSSITFYSRLNL